MIKSKQIMALVVLVTIVAIASGAYAADQKVDVYGGQHVKSVVFVIGLDEYFINGEKPGIKMDVAPFIQDSRTFVPVRYLGNSLGISNEDIAWVEDEQRVILKGSNIVELIIGNSKIWVNGHPQNMDVAPVINNDRTFLPARYVAEALGYEVTWDADTQTVICWPKDLQKNLRKRRMQTVESYLHTGAAKERSAPLA